MPVFGGGGGDSGGGSGSPILEYGTIPLGTREGYPHTRDEEHPMPEFLNELDDIWAVVKMQHSERDAYYSQWRRQYFSEQQYREPIWEGGSAINIPITNWVVDIIHDRLYLSQFGVGYPVIQVKPRDLRNTDKAANMEAVLRFMHQQSKKHHAISLALRDAILLGVGVVRIDVGKDYPVTQWVPAEHFYVVNTGNTLQDATFVMHKYYKQKVDILAAKSDVPREILEDKLSSRSIEDNVSVREGVSPTLVSNSALPDALNLIELVDIFYKDGSVWYMVTYYPDGNFVIRHRRVGLLPFFWLRFIPKGYGEGLAPLLAPFEEELSVIHNQRVDNNTLINLPLFKVLSSSPVLRDKEDWYAGKRLIVDTQDDIQPLVVPEKITVTQDEAQLFEYIKLISGVSELLSGNPLRGEKTAYEVEATLAEGSVRFRRYVAMVAEWMVEQALYELKLIKRHYQKQALRLTGINVFDMIDEDALVYEYELVGNTILTNKEVERQKWILLRNLLAQEPSIAQVPERWYELLRQLLIAFDVDYLRLIGEQPQPQPQTPAPEQSMPPPEAIMALAQQGALPPELMAAIGSLGGGGQLPPIPPPV